MAESEFVLTLEGMPELLAKIARLPEAVRQEVAGSTLLEAAQKLERHVKKEKLSGQVLHVRSGDLRSSVTHVVSQEGQEVVARIGPHMVYAAIHEFGGTITARRVANLTIPVGPALNPSGIANYTARQLIDNPAIGGFKRTFFKNHKLFGVTPGGKAVCVFVLKPSVMIPARPYMHPSLADMAQEIYGIITAGVDRAIKQVFG